MAKVVLRRILLTMIVLLLLNSVAIAKGTFEVVGESVYWHDSESAKLTKLQDGRFLVSEFVKNYSSDFESYVILPRFEIYNPNAKAFEKIPQPKFWRYTDVPPIVLDDGKVLILGSWESNIDPRKSYLQERKNSSQAEIYNPLDNTYEIVGTLQVPRMSPGIAKLKNGKVLVTNGNGVRDEESEGYLRHSELYDPATKKFTLHTKSSIDSFKKFAKVGKEIYYYDEYINRVKDTLKPVYPEGDIRNRLPAPRVEIYEKHQDNGFTKSIVLDNGEVFVLCLYRKAAEIYNPKTQQFRRIEDLPMEFYVSAELYKIPDGRVVIIGKSDSFSSYSIIIFNPKVERYEDMKVITNSSCNYYNSVLLNSGKILIYGTFRVKDPFMPPKYFPLQEMMLYDPAASTLEAIDERPKHITLGPAIQLEDGSIFFVASVKGRGRGVIYKNEKLMKGE